MCWRHKPEQLPTVFGRAEAELLLEALDCCLDHL